MTHDTDETPHFPLIDATDHDILMHRDAHFGGKFSIMLEYYQQEGKGVQPEFDIQRIEQLAALEDQLKQNLAALYLDVSEAERVGAAREAYKQLRAIYEVKNPKSPLPQLIADLILSEEEEAETEIAAIEAEKQRIVPELISLIRNEELHDPLFPGYGQAPVLAVKCLSRIGDKRALIALFEELGHGDFFADDQIIGALKAIGAPAQEFLLRVLKGHPLTEDNERAAIALIAFKDEPGVAEQCFELLQQPEVLKDPCLPVYLVLICAGMKDPQKRHEFQQLSKQNHFPSTLIADMKAVMHSWSEEQAEEG